MSVTAVLPLPRKAPPPVAETVRDTECEFESPRFPDISLGRLLARSLRDWHQGDRGRALARMGYLRAPQTRGRVIWVLSGGDYASVRLGVEAVRAIREKRLDVRLVFTFTQEFPALLEPLHASAKTGWGFAPDNHPRAWRRAVERIAPFAMIWVGATPGLATTQDASSVAHRVLLNACGLGVSQIEFAYPASDAQAETLGNIPQSPVCDFSSLLANAHVDPNFVSAVNGGKDRRLWWLHGSDSGSIRAVLEAFKPTFPDDILFVSGCLNVPSENAIALSAWDRQPLARGVVWVDDPKWLPAIAAGAVAVHFQTMARDVYWQAMAGGLAVTRDNSVLLPKASLTDAVERIEAPDALMAFWRQCVESPLQRRRQADRNRRLFWEERRLAAELNAAFLQRVFDW